MNINQKNWEESVNSFIKKWCGDNAPHLLDTDENDGEKLRTLLNTQKAEILEEAERELLTPNSLIGNYSIIKDLLTKLKNNN